MMNCSELATIAPDFDAIPQELAQYRMWTLWKRKFVDGKWKKPPCTPDGEQRYGSVDGWQLGTLEEVASAYLYDDFGGVGLVPGAVVNGQGQRLAALDIDDCNSDPEKKAAALRVMREAGCTYIEASPSGQGLRGLGWVDADSPGVNLNEPDPVTGVRVEVATAGKYFTVTGAPLLGLSTPSTMSGFKALVARLKGGGEIAPPFKSLDSSDLTGLESLKKPINQQTVDDLRPALAYLAGDGYGQSDTEWTQVGQCLKGGAKLDGGQWATNMHTLWMEYSRSLEGYDTPEAQREAERWWRGRGGDTAHPNQIFTLAQKLGWVNPRMGTAPPLPAVEWTMPKRVDFSHILQTPPPPVVHAWGTCTPKGEVTLLGAHGGTGKSMFALQLGVHVAAGMPFMDRSVTAGRVVFFSGEDGIETLHRRLAAACTAAQVDPSDIADTLIVLDATEQPTLYSASDRGQGQTTPIYTHLLGLVRELEPVLLVVDNASDVFDGNEVARAQVRHFLRLVKALSPNTSVLLLVHLAKASVTATKANSNSEDYSGSTAWHNSARSRLSLRGDPATGLLTLSHQKSNHGRLQLPINMKFTDTGTLAHHVDPTYDGLTPEQVTASKRDKLLLLIEAAYQRGEYVAPSKAPNTPNAYKVLSTLPDFPPNTDRAECLRLVDDLERAGRLMREQYMNEQRKTRFRWVVCGQGESADDLF